MAAAILDGTGSGYLAAVTSDNRLLVDISGATINIGSVSANVDSIYVQSGTLYVASGNVGITGSVQTYDLGSQEVHGDVSVNNFGDLGSSVVVENFGDLGSNSVITNFGDLGSSVVVENFPTTYPGSVAITTNPVPISGTTSTMLYNSAGSEIDTHYDADGGAHLGAAIIQGILTSAGNSTTDNIVAGGSFVGSAVETFGVNGLQVYAYADKATTIYVDQSLDATNWDITDSFDCLANIACTRTYTSVAPYFRGRVENTSDSTTSDVRFAMGVTPIISPLPRALSEDGRLKSESTLVGRENTTRHVWVNPTNELAVSPVYRMIGTAFDGTTKDPNFWTETVVNGSVTQGGGAVTLQTSAAANSSAKYVTARKARFVPGSAQLLTAGIGTVAAPTAGNTRRVGAYDGTEGVDGNGFFFELDGLTFSVGSRKDGTDSLISSGSFNGNMGVSWTPTPGEYYKLQIEMTPLAAIWYVDGVRLHSIKAPALSDTLTLPITIENVNTTNNTDIGFICVGAFIARQGELHTNPTYYYADGANTTVLKYGAGVLHRVTVTDNDGDMTLYDALTNTAGTEISVIDAAKTVGTMEFGAPFSDGLYIVSTNNTKMTVVYE